MGGEDSRAKEEDSAFLFLIMSNVIWREKREVGLATHTSLAVLQRRGAIEGKAHHARSAPFRPLHYGPSAGRPVGQCPKDSHLGQQELPRER